MKYDTKIYNSKNLKEEDKKQVRITDWLVSDVLSELKHRYENEDTTTFGKLGNVIKLQALEDVAESYERNRTEYIVSCIDNYEEYIFNVYPECESVYEWHNPFARERKQKC